MHILIFVDDLLIFSDLKEVMKTKGKLASRRFKMKDLGLVRNYVGITDDYNFEDKKGNMTLSQVPR